MIFKTLSLLILIHAINGASRYFISSYAAPLVDDTYQAYPIDVCIIYKITLDGLTPVANYAKYSCNQDGSVTFTDYGDDSSCETSVGTTEYSSSAADGEVNAFNCDMDGNDDYSVIDGCQMDASDTPTPTTCCSTTDCISNTQASDVCVNYGDGTWFTVSCDVTSTVTYSYSAAGCDESTKDPTPKASSTFDICDYYETVFTKKIYLRMNACYSNGKRIDVDTFCGWTNAPTQQTSNPTQKPTRSPLPAGQTHPPTLSSMTNTTTAPSQSDNEGGVVYNYNVISLVILLSIVSLFIV